jgi:hypothetical protein
VPTVEKDINKGKRKKKLTDDIFTKISSIKRF